jgi:L-threonylcarbamoyladenylate synthase
LVVPKTDIVPPIVTSGLSTVAMRVPDHPAARALIHASGCELAAPSANKFGQVSPTEAAHVYARLGGRIDLILDGGRCPVGVESTILSLAGPTPRLLRVGGIAPEALEALVGPLERPKRDQERPESPGQLTGHYATNTPLKVLGENDERLIPRAGEHVGLLAFTPPAAAEPYAAVEVLSPKGDLREAAANLFAALHILDGLRLDRIVAQPVPEHGLGIAIMDRLRRCAAGCRPEAAGSPS